MRSAVVSFIFLLALCAPAAAQSSSPTPSPTLDGEVVKITTSLIQLDVTVTDKSGRVVTDLKPGEVEVFENGQKQPITGFSFISNAKSSEQMTSTRSETILPAKPPTRVGRSIAIVVDDLNLSNESMVHVRQALYRFVDEQMQDGDLIAIMRTGAGIGTLQQFTNDKRALRAAIDKLRWNPLGSGTTTTYEQTEGKYNARFGGRPPTPGERTLAGLKREFEDFRQSVFATGTLGSVNFVVGGMKDLPGRKSIMLLSDGFRLYSEDANGFREYSKVMESLRRTVDAANRASVVIYTVEARGLETNGLTAADSTNGWDRTEIGREVASRRNKIEDTQEGLGYLAKQTGGAAIINTSDLSIGIRKILDDQSYYLIAYEPDDATFDPKARRFNSIEIKVTRPETNVRYRSGFFAVSNEANTKPALTVGERLSTVLTSPFGVNDISLRLNALFYNSPKGATIRSLVHVRAQDLTFTDEPDGKKKSVFDAVAVSFGENGIAVDKRSDTQTLVLNKAAYEKFLKFGFVYDFLVPVKKPGAYQFRVAIRDHGSDKIGSASQFVDVPEMKENKLVLSGVVLENIDREDWERQRNGQSPKLTPEPLRDTSMRRFKRGTVLNYGFSIYSARLSGGKADLSYRTSVFRDGKLIFEGKNQPVVGSGTSPVNFTSALSIGAEMEPGDYVLQIVITDNLTRSAATQFVQFEIVE